MLKAKKVDVDLVPDETLTPNRIYSNYVEITQTPYDFSLRFCDAGPIKFEKVPSEKIQYKIPVVAHIVVPKSMIPSLINALSIQLQKHQEAYGKEDNASAGKNKGNIDPS